MEVFVKEQDKTQSRVFPSNCGQNGCWHSCRWGDRVLYWWANKSKDMSMAVADADRMQQRQVDEMGVTEAANVDAALKPDQSMRDDASLVEEMDANVQVPEDDWLTGGTSSLPNDVPNMIFGPPDACCVRAQTSGPCTTEPPIERRDISEG